MILPASPPLLGATAVLLAATLVLPARAAADGIKLEDHEGITLAFVFDSTGSMSDELHQVKQAMQEILDFMRVHHAKEIADFALVPFNDPEFGPATITTNAEEYRASLEAINVDGGGDCPELSMHGIKLALERSRPSSHLFVFTDASAKDHAMKSEVEDLIQLKKSKVVFVLTGMCSDKSDPGYQAYERIADISNGHVFNLLKNEVHKVLEFVKVDTVKKGVITSGVIPAGHKIENVSVDESITRLTVTATGKNPTIGFTDPTGKREEGKTTLDIDSAVSKEVENPLHGKWTIDLGSEDPGRYIVAAESSFDFDFGFALNPTYDILETSHRPLAGAKNILLIRITNSTNISHLVSIVFKDTKDEELDEKKLHSVPGKKDVYVIDGMFIPPSIPFFIQVFGIDINNNTLTRTSDSGVTPQLPSPPVVTLAEAVVAVQGEPFVLKCHVMSLVPFVASWLKDSDEVKDDEDYVQSAEVLLNIEKATTSLNGTYTCRAKNSAGTVSKNVKVLLEAKPVLQEPEEKEVSVASGSTRELPCTVLEGTPSPAVKWYRDGEVLEREELLSVGAEIHPNNSLIFSYVKLENEGLYECEAVNTRGKDIIKMPLKVLVLPSIIDEDYLLLEVMLSDAVQLPCAVHGDPKPRVFWIKDKEPLRDLSAFWRCPRDDSLYIMSVIYDHNGTYQCLAANSVGEVRKTIDVLVQDKPRILPVEEQLNAKIGDEVTLICEVEAFPQAEIKWYKNGILLEFEDISYGDNNSSLRLITGITSTGKYECVATNDAGEDRLLIEVSAGVPPHFNSTDIEKIVASAGDNVSLLCNTDAFPPPTYAWVKYPGRTPQAGNSVLTLYNVQPDEAEIYNCEVQNDEGFAQKYFKLIVYAPPVIRDFPEKQALKRGSIFELQCLADGKPTPKITWLKGDEPVDPESEDHSWLYIDSASEDDAGIYVCRAENYDGVDEKQLVIDVEAPPTIGKIDLRTIEANASETVSLSCPPITGNPPPKVQWIKGGLPIVNSRRHTLEDGGKTLRLKKITKHSAGVYTCTATNVHGTAQANVTLKILQPPRFLGSSVFDSVAQLEGISIDLNCSNRGGDPEPEVTWLRNDHPLTPNIIPRVIKSENDQVLTIVSAELSDNGLYKCIVENKAGRIERSFKVQVLMGGIPDEGVTSEGTWGEWSVWSECSASCGHSEQVRTRKCSGFSLYCDGEADQWRPCHIAECKVDGGWSSWSPWSPCPASCGSGKRCRSRICDSPPPLHGGDLCFGSNSQSEPCNTAPCPVDGGWSEWSEWRACTGACPNGTQKRFRKCVNPPPAFGGKPCAGEGIEYRPCILEGCPVAGGWAEWGPWSSCSATCGQARERTCTNPEPQFGGDLCKGESKQTRRCQVEPCEYIPVQATIRVEGSLNDRKLSDVVANVSISESSLQRLLHASATNIFKSSSWFPYFSAVVSPVTWITAQRKNEASNGFSLTKGVFQQTTHLKFVTGEEFVLIHKSHGVDSDGVLQLDAHIEGSVPLFSSKVKIQPYKEYYIQTAPGELFASSHSSVEGGGSSVKYSWNKNIKYDPELGRQTYLSEILSIHNIVSRTSHHSESAVIDKSEKEDCPEGFSLSGDHCRDVDECAGRRIHKCHYTQSCVNAVGTYSCECPSGSRSETKGTPCEDVDECADRRIHKCHYTQSCVNAVGAHFCECPSGSRSETKGTPCEDVNECSVSPAVCSHKCWNLDGNFQCKCPPGLHLLDSNTTCSSIYPVRKTPAGDEVTWTHCLPHQVEVEGFCEERNPCENGEHQCGEEEMCLNIHGLYSCLPFPCPPGHQRIEGTKHCIMECSTEFPCDSGAEISEKFVPVVVSLEDQRKAYRDIISLPLVVEGETMREHTSYRILENEEGKPFRVKIENGVGNLYSKTALPNGKQLRVVILGTVYDDEQDHILHATKFSVLIRTPDK